MSVIYPQSVTIFDTDRANPIEGVVTFTNDGLHAHIITPNNGVFHMLKASHDRMQFTHYLVYRGCYEPFLLLLKQ